MEFDKSGPLYGFSQGTAQCTCITMDVQHSDDDNTMAYQNTGRETAQHKGDPGRTAFQMDE